MVEKVITETRNVLDFRSYQQSRKSGVDNVAARPASGAPNPARTAASIVVCRLAPKLALCCRHCGAALLDGESDDDCSSAGLVVAAPGAPAMRATPRRFYAE